MRKSCSQGVRAKLTWSDYYKDECAACQEKEKIRLENERILRDVIEGRGLEAV